MKLILIFILTFKYIGMDAQIIDWKTACDLKNHPETIFLENIHTNFSAIYQLKDCSYLVIPVNAFGKSLLTKDKADIEKWTKEKYFPTNENMNPFYDKNIEIIKELNKNIPKLKKELFDGLNIPYKNDERFITEKEIDAIFLELKNKIKYNKYKLNFLVLVADYLNKQDNYKWKLGILSMKQLLNPVFFVSLISENKYYFNIEERTGAKRFWGLNETLQDFKKGGFEIDEFKDLINLE